MSGRTRAARIAVGAVLLLLGTAACTLAVDTEDGLFVPVLRNIAERDAADLRRGIEAMKKDVRARKVPVAELRGQIAKLLAERGGDDERPSPS